MIFRSPGPIALDIGFLQIRWYGLLIAVGILLCYLYALTELKRKKLPIQPLEDSAFWVILAGVLGARLYYVIFQWSYYSAHLAEAFQIWKGGLAIHGALLAGGLTFFFLARHYRLSFFPYADALAPGVLLAQAVGRFGNFFNNEAFGRPTELPWKLFIPPEFRPGEYANFSSFHPTFLYESLWNFCGVIALTLLARITHQKNSGLIFFAYLLWYSIGRFFIESLRTDSLYFGPFRVAQLMSMALFVAGILGLVWRTIKVPKTL